MFHSIRRRIAIPYVVLVLLIMTALALCLSKLVRDAYLDDLRSKLTSDALLLGGTLASQLDQPQTTESLDTVARYYADLLSARITIIDADGAVLGESHDDRSRMGNHLYRPEVQQALNTGQGSTIRYSDTVNYDMMYVAVPVMVEERVVGIVRVALPLRQIAANVSSLRNTILIVTLVAASLTVLLAFVVAARIAKPLGQLTRVAGRMAEGDLDARVPPSTRDEVGQLTRAFNQMANQLQEKVTELADERSRLAAVLEHMAAGALITDANGRVSLINPAAARLLGTTKTSALGSSFAQVARHHELIELWQRCRERSTEQVQVVELDHKRTFLQVVVTLFREADSKVYLIILQDLTRIRRLETVRRDFISNISHELRTPLASLKALVDTLRSGALEDRATAQHFLDSVETEVDALTQMVQELLELSRIESGQVPLRLVPVLLSELVLPAVERLRPQAERAGLTITIDLSPDLPPVLADIERARQVVSNLVHNAIKFTLSGGQVSIAAKSAGDEVVITVCDTGIGIPAEDLPRIFERFYKADRTRSSGGTGLGLAIAKHLVQGHGGRIWAESTEGRGSTFFFTLLLASQLDKKVQGTES